MFVYRIAFNGFHFMKWAMPIFTMKLPIYYLCKILCYFQNLRYKRYKILRCYLFSFVNETNINQCKPMKHRAMYTIQRFGFWNLFICRKLRDNSFLSQWAFGMSLIFGHSDFEFRLECANIICSWNDCMITCLMTSACHVSCYQNTTCTMIYIHL